MEKKLTVFELCDRVREVSLNLHSYLRYGHLEKVYENGLSNRLRRLGLRVIQQYPLAVFDEDDTVLGEYFADLYVEEILLVELKACRAIASQHTAQILGYLRACHIEHGMLINFGAPKLEVKKYVLSNL